MSKISIPAGVEAFEIYGSLFFGAVEYFKDAMRRVLSNPKVLILRMRDVSNIDASGLRSLRELHHDMARKHCALVLSAVSTEVFWVMKKGGFTDELGEDRFANDIYEALDIACVIMQDNSPGPREVPN